MARRFGTNSGGGNFTNATLNAVWNKAVSISGRDSNLIRKDICGNEIWWPHYGDITSKYGWEVDHIKPVSNGGSDDLSNLQAMKCETNRSKGDQYPWSCR